MKQLAMAFLFMASLGASAQNLAQGLLLDYKFNGNTSDSSSNHYDGTAFNLAYGPDRYGNANSAAHFNGTNGYMNFPNLGVLKPALPVTFSFYIKYESPDYNRQVVFNTSFEEDRCTGVWFNSSINNNGHAINYGNGAYSYTSVTRRTFLCEKPIVTDVWYHVVCVVNSALDMKIYFDCENITDGTYSGSGGPLVYSSTPGCIGRHDRNLEGPPGYLEGYVDDFRYWNRALSEDEISSLCQELSTEQFAMAQNDLVIYPNPAKDNLNLTTNLQHIESCTIYNALGQQMYAGDFGPTVSVAHFASGIYFVTIKNDQVSVTRKVLITH